MTIKIKSQLNQQYKTAIASNVHLAPFRDLSFSSKSDFNANESLWSVGINGINEVGVRLKAQGNGVIRLVLSNKIPSHLNFKIDRCKVSLSLSTLICAQKNRRQALG